MQKLKILNHLILLFLKKHRIIIGLLTIIIASFTLMIFSARSDSLVVDEKVHISAGYTHTWQGDYTFNTEHPPLLNDLAGLFAKLAKPNIPAVPVDFSGGDQWEYGDMFFYEAGNNVAKILFWARLPFILLTLGLIYLVFLWSRTLFGAKAGLLAAVLAAFSPNILAHGRLATTDIGVAFFFLLTCWLLRKYYLKPNWSNAAFLGLSVGLVLLAKFSGVVILPIVIIGLIFLWLSKKPPILKSLGQFIIVLVVPMILLWSVYAFSIRASMSPLPASYQMSRTFDYQTIKLSSAKFVLMPFDKYFQGIDILSDHNTAGHWAYLNSVVDYKGWWYYFPLVLWYKMTVVEMALLAVSAGFFVWRRIRDNFFDEFLIIFPPLLFLAVSMVGKIDIGIRHILPILPFVYIFIARLAKTEIQPATRSPIFRLNDNTLKRVLRLFRFRKIIILAVLLHIAISILAFPNYIAYFNQIAGGARGGIKHLADSNLDWNQNMNRFGEYARQNNIKKVYELCWDGASFTNQGIGNEILPNSPVEGVVVICAQQMVVPPEGFEFSWVTKYPPDDVISNGMYIWRFPKGV